MTARVAPPLRHPARPWRLPRVGAAALAAGAAAVLALWAVRRPDLPPAWIAGVVAWSVWVVLAWRRAAHAPGWLAWHPPGAALAGWSWQPAGATVPRPLPSLHVAWAGHRGVLLQARLFDGGVLWLVCRAADADPAAWRALRRALAATAAPPPSAIVGKPIRP